MANQPAPDKQMLSVRIARALYLRLVKQAKRRRMSLADLTRCSLQEAAADVELTPEDHARIAGETRAHAFRRARKEDVPGVIEKK